MDYVPEILTVSELTAGIRQVIEENFRYVNVTGEISNFKIHSQSGHWYLTLKDENSQVQAVVWRSKNEAFSFIPEDGMQVIVRGRITVYPARGTYQVEVWEMKPQGLGDLQLKFEKLKQKLFEEGLFDESHKKQIPAHPENVAIITSGTGAVLQDFIRVANRRYPVMNLFLYPANVQGNIAAHSVIEGIHDIQKLSKDGVLPKIEIIIIARGGGSIEDLWPFNDEKLAHAIYDCKIPVVSAIGHEVDFTICDFVADLRAPTPSAAAELITPDMKDLIETLDKFSYFSRSFVQNRLDSLRNSLKEIQGNYYFNRPKDIINNFYQNIDEKSKTIVNLTENRVSFLKNQMMHFEKTLHHISIDNNLKKGYAVVSSIGGLFDDGKIVMRASKLKKNDDVEIKFYDNKKLAKITK